VITPQLHQGGSAAVTLRTFQEAESYCQTLGGGAHLGSVETDEERERIYQTFKESSFFNNLQYVWIGLSNVDFTMGTATEEWHWADGR
jgi:hypothetical protein